MSKPPAPNKPEVTVDGPSTLKVAWTIPETSPEITACTVKMRIVGSQRYQNYDHASGKLVLKGGATVPAPTCEITASGCEEGLAYEAVVAMMNSNGWGEISTPSEPMTIGDPKAREKPPSPGPPKLIAMGPGKLKCSWVIPEACPPVEATQVQLTDVASGIQLLVDAANGKLVSSGRTTFASTRWEANINGVKDCVEYVAAVCCRNAEGFGEYSLPSDSAANGADPRAEGAGMQLVLLEALPGSPLMTPLKDGTMKVSWTLPEEAKSTMVKMRRVGDNNWYLCGGSAIAAPASETIAQGLEEGIQYESMVAFLINGRWCCESPVSRPTCIGELKLPGLPGAPKEPRLFISDQGNCRMKVKWQPFTSVPPLTGATVKFRALGAHGWSYIDPASSQIVVKEPEPILLPTTEVEVVDLQPGIRYEACVAVRNKLGKGPYSGLSEPCCIGRPIPHYMKCTLCFADFDMQHSAYSKNAESFWCPLCRFRQMDPFNAIVEPYGFLLCHIVMRPTIAFSIDLPDLKTWRKDDHSVFVRMVRIDSENCAQVWPRKVSLEANGHEVFKIEEPEEGHVRRDLPKDISAGLRPGMNTIVIKLEDDYLPGFALALCRTQSRTAQQISMETPMCEPEAAKARVMSLLADTWSTPLDNDEEEITCVISNKLKLRCPLSFEKCVIPCRGEQCMHLQCFGLGAYLESNMKMRALNNRWTCPVCTNVLKPRDLRVDAYVERVLSETPSHVEEVLIMQDGSYRIIEELPQDPVAAQAQQAAREREVALEKARAEVQAAAEEGEVLELPTTIDDADGVRAGKRKQDSSVLVPLTKRQRARREKAFTVPGEDDHDSD
mmetsp:Transcript_124464/g.265273  ORF Transcript_124464/g.265273 Transcript_124464/m.265273 type:complete len:837 (+) Transcript_124464:155-2665(+)